MKKAYRLILSAGLIFLIFLCIDDSYAVGALFSRPRFSEQQYNKMWIKSVQAGIDIQEQIAVTHIDQIFYNEMDAAVEAIYIFPLPENAMITELVYWCNGQRFVANIRERQQAVNDYNKKLRQWLDPALLEYLGDNLFRLSIVPIDAHSEVRTEITYVEALKYDLGLVNYVFQLNTLQLSPRPLATVSVSLNARSQSSFKTFTSPTHENSTAARLEKIADNHYTFFYGDENFYPDADLVIRFETERENVAMHVLTYTPTPADSFGTDSFYALWITPPDELADDEIIPKDIVFTADVSSSMEGERIEQVKNALNHFLHLLNPVDRFNIITFGTFTEKFRNDLVAANDDNIRAAGDYVFGMYALGMTNIDQALTTSLKQSYRDTTSNNLIFLTDGYPTLGQLNPDSILSHANQCNNKEVRIFSFGVGKDISRAFLTNLSAENHGYAKFITSDDSIALVVNDHFTRISRPVLRDIEVDLGGLQAWDQYPKVQQDLFWGNQILKMGLYENSGFFDVTLKGKVRSEVVEYAQTVNFPDTAGGHRFVPRLWAKAKIDHILGLIAAYGENQELVDQVIELSLRFQILTPYTAFYSDPDEDDPDDDSTPIDDRRSEAPEKFALFQNYPNPFNPETTINYDLPQGQTSYQVKLRIFNTLGQCVRTLVAAQQQPGNYAVNWNGCDETGHALPSGIYLCVIEAGNFRQTMKMALLR